MGGDRACLCGRDCGLKKKCARHTIFFFSPPCDWTLWGLVQGGRPPQAMEEEYEVLPAEDGAQGDPVGMNLLPTLRTPRSHNFNQYSVRGTEEYAVLCPSNTA